MVLVDTSAWIDADHRPDSPEARELADLLDRDEVATTDIVVAELLQGASSADHFKGLAEKLEAVHYLHAEQGSWLKAAEMSYQLKRQGLTTPLSDLLIASVALTADIAVFATDPHFTRVPGLKLHEWPK